VAEKGENMSKEHADRREQRMDREFISRRTGKMRGGSWQETAYLYAKSKRKQIIVPGVVMVWAK
jgi:hypothetical protein